MSVELVTIKPDTQGAAITCVDGVAMAESLQKVHAEDTHLGSAYRLQSTLFEMNPEIDTAGCKVTHEFSDGIYIRTMFIPANTLIVAMRYKYARIATVHSGSITIAHNDEVNHYIGPVHINAAAGDKRVVFTHTDTYISTTFPTQLTAVDEVIKENMHPEEVGV